LQSWDGERERLLRELEFRVGVTSVMLSTLDLDYILYVILTGITSGDGLGFNRAFLFLDDDRRALKVKLALGPESAEDARRIWSELEREHINFSELLPRFDGFRQDTASQSLTRKMAAFAMPLNHLESLAVSTQTLILAAEAPLSAVMARCLLNQSPFASNSLTLIHEVGGGAGEVLELRNVAVVPLLVEGVLMGAIVADNRYSARPVDSEALRSLHALGNLAALAIDRARLHARTVAMAEVDGLTGVYNRRYYAQAVEQAIERAGHSGQSLSVVVFDLDHFKRFNDQYGHLVGDELLKGVAKLLVEHVRSTDVVARYGGEEFVVLLKETSAEGALSVAEKLRTTVQHHPFVDGLVEGLTVSAGVACTTGNESPEELFQRADRALYRAKEEGRNRVRVASSGGTR